MPAKTILMFLFLVSLGVVVVVSLHALPQAVGADTQLTRNEVLVLTQPVHLE